MTALRLGRLAVTIELLFIGILTVWLALNTDSGADVVPRPIALLLLYATPGIVALFGLIGRRRSLVFAAAVVLLPGSVISIVTVIFFLPAILLWLTSLLMAAPGDGRGSRLTGALEIVIACCLMLGAAVALFSTTAAGCTADGSTCGDGFLTWTGVGLAVAIDLVAIAFAAWRSDLTWPSLGGVRP